MNKPIGGDGPGAGEPSVREHAALGVQPTVETGMLLARRIIRVANRLRHHPEQRFEAESALAGLLAVDRESAFRRAREILEISVQRSVLPLIAEELTRPQRQTKLLIRALLFVMAMEEMASAALA